MKDVTENNLYTLSCTNAECWLQFRLGRVIRFPVTRNGPIQYCPVCQSKAIISVDTEQDYWESLAKQYELPVDILIAIHGVWNSREQPSFGRFVEEMKKEAVLVK